MRKVLIVGAGQSGLQLALSLLEHDYDVTVMSARTPDEIRYGRTMSTQGMFGPALQLERDHDLNLWEQDADHFEGVNVSVGGSDGARQLSWVGNFAEHGQSIDQRVKMAGWLELVEQRGGKVVIHGVTTADVDALTRMYDLVVIAAGKGELVQLFDRDPQRSPFTTPQRALAFAYAHGVEPRPEHPDRRLVRFNALPGLGELFIIPAYTLSGNCDILFFEAVPGGPLDRFQDKPGPHEQLDRIIELTRQYMPWEYERVRRAELTDAGATLAGQYPPVVRKPVGELPSGNHVLGMADVVVANDPITAQGSNSAAKCAASYLESILARGERPFDREWMHDTFESYWSEVRVATEWTNMMLRPLPQHVMDIIMAAADKQAVADRFVNGFADPRDLENWFMSADKAADYLASM